MTLGQGTCFCEAALLTHGETDDDPVPITLPRALIEFRTGTCFSEAALLTHGETDDDPVPVTLPRALVEFRTGTRFPQKIGGVVIAGALRCIHQQRFLKQMMMMPVILRILRSAD